jgi:thiol-disulfide isomerase/thioredoxin
VTRGPRSMLAVALVAALLGTAGCAGVRRTPRAAARPAPAPAATRPAVPATLAFTGRTLDGAPFDAATLAGRPTVLWFWAPWCATCASEASTVTDTAAAYGDRLGVVGVAGMGDNKAMHQFVTDLDVAGVTNLDDSGGVVWRRFGITQQSVYVVLDRQGRVVHNGYLDDQQFTGTVRGLVG